MGIVMSLILVMIQYEEHIAGHQDMDGDTDILHFM